MTTTNLKVQKAVPKEFKHPEQKDMDTLRRHSNHEPIIITLLNFKQPISSNPITITQINCYLEGVEDFKGILVKGSEKGAPYQVPFIGDESAILNVQLMEKVQETEETRPIIAYKNELLSHKDGKDEPRDTNELRGILARGSDTLRRLSFGTEVYDRLTRLPKREDGMFDESSTL